MTFEDPYKILGLERGATDDEVKRAYRQLAKKYHPDLNPGDMEAARKMQEVNAAYEQIKNPDKPGQNQQQSGGSYYDPFSGFDPFGGYQQQQRRPTDNGDQYQQAAYQYIRFGRYQEALNTLNNSSQRDGRWYYLSALANRGLGNQVTALEHIRKAVSMDPDNLEYQDLLNQIENGSTAYRQQAGQYQGYTRGTSCPSACMCFLTQLVCCRGRFFCC